MAHINTITRKLFIENATPVDALLNNVPVQVGVKEFSTGTLGWYTNGKATLEAGKPVHITVNGQLLTVKWKQFSTGSWGWQLSGGGQAKVKVGDQTVQCTLGGNLTVVGSKTSTEEPRGMVNVQVDVKLFGNKSKDWAVS